MQYTPIKLLSMMWDTVEYGAGGDGKDEDQVLLHAAADEGTLYRTCLKSNAGW
jgi:hypothetical protein